MKLLCPRLSASHVAFAAAVVFAAGACSLNVEVNDPVAIIKTTDNLTAPTNTQLSEPLSVLVTNQFGQPIGGVTVRWTVLSGGGTLSDEAVRTDDGGVSRVNFTTGSTPGTATVQAQTSGIPPVTFTITVT